MFNLPFASRLIGVAGAALASATVLVACGGGGDSGPAAPGGATAPSVSSVAIGAAKYGQKLLLTVRGSNLDRDLAVSATGCKDVALSTVAPNVSSTSTAYYLCAVSAVGAGQFRVTQVSNAAVLATQPFTVAVPQVTLTVSNGAGVGGTMVVTLAPDKTPLTVDNFLGYVNSGFYDGTVFHRVSPGFVVQGGGYVAPVVNNTPTLKPTVAPIALEVNKGLSNTQWTIAMARTSEPASATSQFYINLVDNSGSLDPSPINGAGYAVFGSVASGTATVTAIVGAPCTAIAFFLPTGECTPTPNMLITSAIQTQ